jgi:hypothetical protein
MAVNDVVRLDVTGTVGDQKLIISHHFRYLLTGATDDDLINSWQIVGQALYLALFPSAFTLASLKVAQFWPGPFAVLRGTTEESPALNGTATFYSGDQTPAWFASEVRTLTGRRGRRRQGRFFPWVPSESAFVGDTLSSGYIVALNQYRDALLGSYGVLGSSTLYRWVVFSRSTALIPGTHPPAYAGGLTVTDVAADVSSVATSSRLTTQRSRRS